MADSADTKRKPPKGAPPKGGTRYPRYGLKEALAWAKKLVSKTHIGPQPADIIYASVVDSKVPTAEIRVSALKQYGLLKGSSKAYEATDLAKAIAASPPEELPSLYREAALTPSLFKALFDTYHGDEVTTGKLRQRAAELNVHPDNTANAVALYAGALELAGLATQGGDKVTHQAARPDKQGTSVGVTNEVAETDDQAHRLDDAEVEDAAGDNAETSERDAGLSGTPRAIFHVNVNLDASLDTDKLERQLALLKRFGAI